ncbi:hypothetical protein H310_02115 [Aphanomyces invadans]|uniref:SPRY domain-containing protein n=1 Tax=Aphanomyces invadans TaxID=157072 RepID=A0A024UMW0_9STRA|nr:hypothetical protein H310_02115 [Aphanomyces invadans]ETW07649.1 hypothetical protein H310_02115 [Aphanomyces invadans]|eukprot:XP_008863742.1 hypothetical protein H310_02115 [Aphanomyces invadans]
MQLQTTATSRAVSSASAPVLTIRTGSPLDAETPRANWTDPFFTVEEDLCIVRQKCFAPPRWATDAEFLRAFCSTFGVERSIAQVNKRMANLQTSSPDHGILRMYISTLLQTPVESKHDVVTKETLRPEYAAFVEVSTGLESILQPRHDPYDMGRLLVDDWLRLEVHSKRFPEYDMDVPKMQLRKCSAVIDRFLTDAAATPLTPDPVTGMRQFTNGTMTYYPAVGTTSERLVLTDDVAAYDAIPCYDHLSQPVMARLVLFANDQQAVERRLTILDEYDTIQKINRLSNDEINGLYASEAKRYVSVLDNARQREITRTTAFLDQALQNDLAAVHAMHAATLRAEVEKIHAKYADRRDSLVARIEHERLRALELHRDSMDLTMLQLEHAMAVNTQQVESVFGSSDKLLQLLLLAEDLDCKRLRTACIHYLTEPKRFLQFALRRELTSPLLAEHTILALLQHLSDQDIKDLKEESRTGFAFTDLLMREIHTRLIALTKELEALPNATLRDVMRVAFDLSTLASETMSPSVIKLGLATRAYPQVLSKEVDRRREFSRVKLDASLMTNHVTLTGDDLVVELESANRYCTALATKSRRAGEFGRWMFEVTLDRVDAAGGSVAIGWEVPRQSPMQWGPLDESRQTSKESQDAGPTAPLPPSPRGPMARFGMKNGYGMLIPGLTPGEDGKDFGIMWVSDSNVSGPPVAAASDAAPTSGGIGMLYINGKQHSGMPCCRQGDVIGCAIDQDATEPFVTFYLNGTLVSVPGPPSSNLNASGHNNKEGATHGLKKLLLHSANYALYPAVTLFASHDPTARVRFNFRGHFDFPIPGYDPYGAELLDLIEIAKEGAAAVGGAGSSHRHIQRALMEDPTSPAVLTSHEILNSDI